MNDDFDSFERATHCQRIPDIAANKVRFGGEVGGFAFTVILRAQAVKDSHLIPRRYKALAELRSPKPSSARDQIGFDRADPAPIKIEFVSVPPRSLRTV